ncbi:MAG: hypothetical protein EXR74_03580 [Bdellovibrionales bacterium]|nr:hypothetical protein [Bdellovibrionales bacterium]
MARNSKNGALKLGITLIFLGGGLVYSGLRRFRRTRKVEDTPTSPIQSATQGYVEIQGNAWPVADSGTKNLKGRNCVFRHLDIQVYVESGKNSRWKTVYEERSEKPFIVFDTGGAALVRPQNAELELTRSSYRWSEIPPEIQLVLRERVKVRGFPPSKGIFGASFRFEERAIVVGSPVYVKGNFTTPVREIQVTPQLGHEAFREKLTKISLHQYARFFDKNNDGEVCAQEAIDGFHAASQVSQRQAVGNTRNVTSFSPPAISCQGEMASSSMHKLYVADCAQHHLIKRIGNWNILRIVGGAVLIGIGVMILITELKK